jgi:hypothetical protein
MDAPVESILARSEGSYMVATRSGLAGVWAAMVDGRLSL